jgi:hypothetical protein
VTLILALKNLTWTINKKKIKTKTKNGIHGKKLLLIPTFRKKKNGKKPPNHLNPN